jgi:chromosomal replication initiation ATPase DnaA
MVKTKSKIKLLWITGIIGFVLSAVIDNPWFVQLRLLTINENDIVIIVPYPIYKNHITSNYMDIIEEIFLEITGTSINDILFRN